MEFASDESALRVLKVMRRKVGHSPDAAGFHTLGCAELHLGLAPEAMKHLRRAVELRPDFGEALLDLARACLENRNPAGAKDAADRAAALGLALPPGLRDRLG